MSGEQINIGREADYIVRRAAALDARIVTLKGLVLFSTQTGDAWMVDPEDCLALCLARGGDRQRFHIDDTATTFSVEWTATYRIDGDLFVVTESRTGRMRAILGYPVQEIQRGIRRARESR